MQGPTWAPAGMGCSEHTGPRAPFISSLQAGVRVREERVTGSPAPAPVLPLDCRHLTPPPTPLPTAEDLLTLH